MSSESRSTNIETEKNQAKKSDDDRHVIPSGHKKVAFSPSTSIREENYDNFSEFAKAKNMKFRKLRLKRSSRLIAFTLFMSTNLVINMDHGTIPAATKEIKTDLGIGEAMLGFFGSMVYLGNFLGAMLFLAIISKINRKVVLLVCLLICAMGLFSFALIKNQYFLLVNRIVVGMAQSFITIYFPVWVDQFGPRTSKTTLMTFLQIGVPLGIVLGYVMTSIIKEPLGWEYGFIVQSGMTVILLILSVFVPNDYFANPRTPMKKPLQSSLISNEKRDRENSVDSVGLVKAKRERGFSNDSKFEKRDRGGSIDTTYIDVLQENTPGESAYKTFMKRFCKILRYKVFILCNFSVANLFFIITAIQFWASDYLRIVLGIEDSKVFVSFAVCCITGPTTGVLFGGFIMNKIGGYDSKYSLLVCLFFAIMATGFALPIVFFDSLILFDIFLWMLLFFGGAIMPSITGIIISSLPHDLKAMGNSFTNIMSNLFGFLPAPFIYGYLYKIFEARGEKRIAMFIIMCYTFAGVIFISLGVFFRFRAYAKVETLVLKFPTEKKIDEGNINFVTRVSAMLHGKLPDISTLEQFNEERGDRQSDNSDMRTESYDPIRISVKETEEGGKDGKNTRKTILHPVEENVEEFEESAQTVSSPKNSISNNLSTCNNIIYTSTTEGVNAVSQHTSSHCANQSIEKK